MPFPVKEKQPASANEFEFKGETEKKTKRGLLSRVAAGLGGLVRAEAGINERSRTKKGKERQPKTLSEIAARRFVREPVYSDTQRISRILKGGIYDFTKAKNSYGVGERGSVFYYGSGKSHYAASGASLKGYANKRFFNG